MDCPFYKSCEECVKTCQWVVRKQLDPICTSDYTTTVGMLEYFVDTNEFCFPLTTTSPPPIIIGYQLSTLLLSNLTTILTVIIIASTLACLYNCKKNRRQEVSLPLVDGTPRQRRYYDYYKRQTKKRLHGFAELVDRPVEEIEEAMGQVNTERGWAPAAPVFDQSAQNIFNVSIPMDNVDNVSEVRLIRTPIRQPEVRLAKRKKPSRPRRNADSSIVERGNDTPLRRADRKGRKKSSYY